MAVIWLGSGRFAGAALWTPAAITTALWLDAADASTITKDGSDLISTWADKSGTGKNATQSDSARPVYVETGLNNKPSVDFDGLDDDLVLSSTTGLNVVSQSFFIVAKRDNSGGRAEIAFSVGSRVTADGLVDLPCWTDNNMYSQVGYAASRPVAASVITDDPYINVVTGGQVQRSYTNGTLLGTGTTQSTSNFAATLGYVGSGRAVSALNRYFDGRISELIVVLSVASTDTRQRIEGYLAHKWGLTANLPNDHPYKSAAPTI